MKNLLVVLILTLTVQSHAYHYNEPQLRYRQEDVVSKNRAIQPGSSVIKGNNGKHYEVTLSPSKKVYETHLPAKEQVFIIRRSNQQPTWSTSVQSQTHSPQPQPQANQGLYGNVPRTCNNPQHNRILNSNQHNSAAVGNNAQHTYNQLTANSYYQPQQHQQQPQHNNNLPKTVNNNNKYISQSEASQLDVYPHKQLNGYPRPFTRIITKCEATGQCVTYNAAYGDNDFYHQQVLQQSKAYTELSNSKHDGYLPIRKGLKDRRFFPYSEVVIPQYPHN